MQALVFHGPWDLRVEHRPDPEAATGQVLLRILATGICGSDLHGFTGENGRRHAGQVMGHETVAEVVEDPSGAHPAGRLVTVNPLMGCGHCDECRAGEPQRCPDRKVIGVNPSISSAFAELMLAPLDNVVPLPPGVSPAIGALVEPLSVGFHAARRGAVKPEDAVLVIGGGPIGQAAALAARRLGSELVVVSEPDDTRRDLCARLGFATVDPAATTHAEEQVRAALGRVPNVVLDAVGVSQTLAAACEMSTSGARIVLVGMGSPKVELSAYDVSTVERTIIGSFCYRPDEFTATVEWAASEAVMLAGLVDDKVDLNEAPDVFTRLAKRELQASKVLVCPGGSRHLPEETA